MPLPGAPQSTQGGYHRCIGTTLRACLALGDFPSQLVERQNRPEVEFKTNPELLLNTVKITRNEDEACLIESSVNSVRLSLKVKKNDRMEEILVRKFMRFLAQRAEVFQILRRSPIAGYDISFLISNVHTDVMDRDRIVDFVVQLIQDIDAEINKLKLSVNNRGRAVAKSFLAEFD